MNKLPTINDELCTDAATDQALEVRVSKSGQFLTADRNCTDALAGLCTTRIVSGPSTNGHGYRTEPMKLELFTRLGERADGQGEVSELRYWAGLGAVAKRLLTNAGYTITDDVPKPKVLPTPNRNLLRNLDGVDDLFLDVVRRQDRGLISYDPDAVTPRRLLAEIALAWPKLKITIAVKRIDEAFALRSYLRQYIPNVECYHTDNHPEKPARVAIATYTFLNHAPIELSWRDIVVAQHAREATCRDAQDQLAKAVRGRLYGLLPSKDEPSPFEQDQVVKLFGFERFHIPAYGKRMRQIGTLFVRAPGKVVVAKAANVVTLLRQTVWTAPIRNRRIVRLARLLAGNQPKALRDKFPAVAKAIGNKSVGGVVVLVDGVDHALALKHQLPAWDVIKDEAACLDRLSSNQRKALVNNALLFPSDTPRVIVTSTGIENINLEGVDVIIRADAGVGLPALPSSSLIQSNSIPHRSLLIIDFLDEDDPVLNARSRQRKKAYAAAEWFAVGVDPIAAPVDAFLAKRK